MPEDFNNFNPSRLIVARKRRGLSQTALAHLISVDSRTLRSYEKDGDVRHQVVEKIAAVLRFPPRFFYGGDLEVIDDGQVSFRALSKMSAAHRDMAKSQGSLAVALSDWIEEAYDLPKCSIPDLREYASSPEEAATILRQTWGIGEASVGNVVHLLELHGVRVFSLAVDSMNVDAFSMWKGSNIPIVMLNTLKSAERSRFDAAHELGHLCLHQHGSKNLNPSIEAQADSFASAFLMPRNSVLANAPAFPTIDRLISLKSRWGVSLAALVYRLRKLNIISEWQYKSLCVQIGKMGYRRAEPQSAERETSGVLQAILRDFHINKSGSRQKIAEALLLPLDEVDALLFGLTYGVTHGKRIGEPKGKAELQLVSSIAP